MPIFGTSDVKYHSTVVEANTSYSDHDMGRILYECAMNDMIIFNANISRDFQEAVAVNEGTMLTRELQAFQEFSVKDAWKKIKEGLKKFWSKVKGVFCNIYAKLSLWLNRNTKAYVEQNKSYLLKKRNLENAKCPNYRVPKVNDPVGAGAKAYADQLKKMVDSVKALKSGGAENIEKNFSNFSKENSEESNPEDTVSMQQMKTKEGGEKIDKVGQKEVDEVGDADSMFKKMEEEYFGDADSDNTWGKIRDSIGGINGLCKELLDSAKYLGKIKELNRTADKAIGDLISWCDKKAAETNTTEENKNLFTNISKSMGYFQTMTIASTNAQIRFIKAVINNYRGLMASLVAHNPDNIAKVNRDANNDSAIFAFKAGQSAYYHEVDDMIYAQLESAATEAGISIDIND